MCRLSRKVYKILFNKFFFQLACPFSKMRGRRVINGEINYKHETTS
jgi:hypothetical protein